MLEQLARIDFAVFFLLYVCVAHKSPLEDKRLLFLLVCA